MKILNKRQVGRRWEYARRHIRREAAMLQRLDHPHVVQLYEILETDNHYYLATELVDGSNMADFLKARYKYTNTTVMTFGTIRMKGNLVRCAIKKSP